MFFHLVIFLLPLCPALEQKCLATFPPTVLLTLGLPKHRAQIAVPICEQNCKRSFNKIMRWKSTRQHFERCSTHFSTTNVAWTTEFWPDVTTDYLSAFPLDAYRDTRGPWSTTRDRIQQQKHQHHPGTTIPSGVPGSEPSFGPLSGRASAGVPSTSPTSTIGMAYPAVAVAQPPTVSPTEMPKDDFNRREILGTLDT